MALKRVGIQGLSVVLILMTLFAYFKRTVALGGYYGASDFYNFYQSLLFHFSGQNIYSNVAMFIHFPLVALWVSENANLNPPFFLFFVWPLHRFNYATAFLIWDGFITGCLFVGATLALRPFPQWHKNTLPILMLFLMFLPTSAMLAYGQVSSILLVILAAAWLLARKNDDSWAGILIGLACAIKLFCGLFLIYFLCLKRFRVIISALVVILITFVLGGLVFGFQSYLSYHALLSQINWYTTSWNVSFYGFFARLFSAKLAKLITATCSAAVVIYLVKRWCFQTAQQFDVGFGIVIVAMILLSPLGWIYYFPLLLIPYLILVSEGNTWTHLGACFLILMTPFSGNLILTDQIHTLKECVVQGGTGFYILIGLLGLLCFVPSRFAVVHKGVVSENLWVLIYALIFMPSLVAMGAMLSLWATLGGLH